MRSQYSGRNFLDGMALVVGGIVNEHIETLHRLNRDRNRHANCLGVRHIAVQINRFRVAFRRDLLA